MNSLEYHEKLKGKIEVKSRSEIKNSKDLSLAYTPGVAEPCRAIAEDRSKVYDYTRKHNMVAVVTDGSAVLGLGNIGAEASLPVMEGKSVLFKEFADVDAFPIALDTQDEDEFVDNVANLAPMFGGINLEDISAPRCFRIEEKLKEKLDIPVFHDDQHGTAIVVLAGLYNALEVVEKDIEDIKVAISGAGAAGMAIVKLLKRAGVGEILVSDSTGIISSKRSNLNFAKKKIQEITNPNDVSGGLEDAVRSSDTFIGVSVPNILSQDMIKSMNRDPIVFALANPDPEIMPKMARRAGAKVVATGRSDFPNQLNNVLAFPGIFRGLLNKRAYKVGYCIKLNAAKALADYIDDPKPNKIIPDVLDKEAVKSVTKAVEGCVDRGEY